MKKIIVTGANGFLGQAMVRKLSQDDTIVYAVCKEFDNSAYKAKGDEKIIHFFRVMGEFPWHKDNMHPFNDLFDKYLSISPWADYEKESSGIAWVFNAEKLLYKYLPESLFIRLFHLSHIYFMKKSN